MSAESTTNTDNGQITTDDLALVNLINFATGYTCGCIGALLFLALPIGILSTGIAGLFAYWGVYYVATAISSSLTLGTNTIYRPVWAGAIHLGVAALLVAATAALLIFNPFTPIIAAIAAAGAITAIEISCTAGFDLLIGSGWIGNLSAENFWRGIGFSKLVAAGLISIAHTVLYMVFTPLAPVLQLITLVPGLAIFWLVTRALDEIFEKPNQVRAAQAINADVPSDTSVEAENTSARPQPKCAIEESKQLSSRVKAATPLQFRDRTLKDNQSEHSPRVANHPVLSTPRSAASTNC